MSSYSRVDDLNLFYPKSVWEESDTNSFHVGSRCLIVWVDARVGIKARTMSNESIPLLAFIPTAALSNLI